MARDSLFPLKSLCYIHTNIFSTEQRKIWGEEVYVIPEYSFGAEVEMLDDIKLSDEQARCFCSPRYVPCSQNARGSPILQRLGANYFVHFHRSSGLDRFLLCFFFTCFSAAVIKRVYSEEKCYARSDDFH